MEKLTIKKGWYRSAGIKYGWIHSGYEPEGVGINREALNGDKLQVNVSGFSYVVDCAEAIAFVKRWKSHYKTDGGTKIGVISKSIMKKI